VLRTLCLAVLLALCAACGRSQTYRPKTPPIIPPPVVPPKCALILLTPSLDFGALDANAFKDLTATVRNDGLGECDVSAEDLVPDGSGFSLVEPVPPLETLGKGDQYSFTVRFAPGPAALPQKRAAATVIDTTDPAHLKLTVNLQGALKLCELHLTPSPLDFGNVTLNAKAAAHLTLSNAGLASCDVGSLFFGPNTDGNFSFPIPPGGAQLKPTQSVQVEIDFAAIVSTPPYLHTGSVLGTSSDLLHRTFEVPLSAFVNTVCTQAGQFIYTVDSNGTFARFDPKTLTSVDIDSLSCPTLASPFSMNVDQKGIAWIIFDDGNLFRVDTATAACTSTSYLPGQHGFNTYGMGSVFDSSSGIDTLYLSSGTPTATVSQLGTLAYPGLTITQVANVPLGWLELSGTGDGQLWGYAPTGSSSGGPLLTRINRTSGVLIEKYDLPEITTIGGFAVKFFGGSFFIFVGPDVWKVDRSALLPGHTTATVPAKRVLTTPGRDVVGAGVSTCAPVQN
jgi:hypothetical protein